MRNIGFFAAPAGLASSQKLVSSTSFRARPPGQIRSVNGSPNGSLKLSAATRQGMTTRVRGRFLPVGNGQDRDEGWAPLRC